MRTLSSEILSYYQLYFIKGFELKTHNINNIYILI